VMYGPLWPVGGRKEFPTTASDSGDRAAYL